MADVIDANATETQGTTAPENNQPSVEELLAQLAEAKAENAKQKATLDKTLKEKGDLTKSLRAKQTTEEQEAEERRLAEEERQKKYEDTLAELNQMKATQAYSGTLADEKAIANIISAVADGDHKSIALIIEAEKKAAVKAAQAEWLKTRPQVNSGTGYSGMTREQIMAIADTKERQIAIANNIELFS